MCVCVSVRQCIPEYSPPKNTANHVCTSQPEKEREGGNKGRTSDKVVEEEEKRGGEGKKRRPGRKI